MYVCMHACVYACMFACTYVWNTERQREVGDVCMHACMSVSVYVSEYINIDAYTCKYRKCACVCICIYEGVCAMCIIHVYRRKNGCAL